MATKVDKSLFDLDAVRDPIPKSAFQKLREQKDFSILDIKDDASADLVRAALKHSRNVCVTLTLHGSWGDDEFRTFTPFMDSVTSLNLINPTFSNTAFDEAFVSNDCHENLFEHTLATYVEEDEWDAVPFKPRLRPPIYTDLSLTSTYNDTRADFTSEGWIIPSPEPKKAAHESKKEKQALIVNCPNLTSLTIVNPTGLSGEFLSKLLPLREQLTSLSLLDWKHAPSAEVIRELFPKLEILVIQ